MAAQHAPKFRQEDFMDDSHALDVVIHQLSTVLALIDTDLVSLQAELERKQLIDMKRLQSQRETKAWADVTLEVANTYRIILLGTSIDAAMQLQKLRMDAKLKAMKHGAKRRKG
jgi:hypothetical protein